MASHRLDSLHMASSVLRIPRVAQVAPTSTPPSTPSREDPPLDPGAVERAYRLHRARRAAKAKRHRERRWASLRFWVVLAFVVAVTAVLAVQTLGEIERVFGL